MLDFILNGVGLAINLGAIYLTAACKERWQQRMGCCLGIVGCAMNIYLQVGAAPWSTLILTFAALAIYIKGANITEFFSKFSIYSLRNK